MISLFHWHWAAKESEEGSSKQLTYRHEVGGIPLAHWALSPSFPSPHSNCILVFFPGVFVLAASQNHRNTVLGPGLSAWAFCRSLWSVLRWHCYVLALQIKQNWTEYILYLPFVSLSKVLSLPLLRSLAFWVWFCLRFLTVKNVLKR